MGGVGREQGLMLTLQPPSSSPSYTIIFRIFKMPRRHLAVAAAASKTIKSDRITSELTRLSVIHTSANSFHERLVPSQQLAQFIAAEGLPGGRAARGGESL